MRKLFTTYSHPVILCTHYKGTQNQPAKSRGKQQKQSNSHMLVRAPPQTNFPLLLLLLLLSRFSHVRLCATP